MREKRQDADFGAPAVAGIAELSRQALLEEYAPASVVVNDAGVIRFTSGPVRNYLGFPAGEPDLDLASMTLEGLRGKVRKALRQTLRSSETVSLLAPRVRRDDTTVAVRIRVRPLPQQDEPEPLFLVSFSDETAVHENDTTTQARTDNENHGVSVQPQDANSQRLAAELQATREDLQSTIEELEAANEELQASNEEVVSMNEELQSANEELEVSQEELQALNEEISAVNSQLLDKVQELESTTNDLSNLLTSTDMATLFFDEDLKIRRYTPAASQLIQIERSDIGRPASELSARVQDESLFNDARRVLQDLTPVTKEVGDGDQWYLRRVTPFRTGENRIAGVVVTYSNITPTKQSERRLESRDRQHAVVAKLGRSALGGEDLETLFEDAVHWVAETLQVDFCKILRLEPDKKSLKLHSGVGWNEGLIGHATVSVGIESQAGYTLHSDGPVVVRDLRTEQRFSGPPLLTDHGVISGVSVLIGPEEAPWGVLGAHTRDRVDFSVDDANFISSIANVLWLAIRRRMTETELEDSQARMAAFLNNSALVAWMKDDRGRYTWLSENFRKRFQVPDHEYRGMTDDDLWPPAIAARLRENDKHVLEVQRPSEMIEEAFYPDGTQCKYLSLKFPFSDYQGNRFVGGLGVDVTARVNAEIALSESEERLRLAAQMARFGTFYYEMASRKASWSPELCEIVGLDPAASVPLEPERIPDFIHPEDRERMISDIRAALDPHGEKHFDDEYRIIRPDGQIRWLLVQGRTVFDGDGPNRKAIRVAGVALDITERHQQRDELIEARRNAEAANEAKSTFLANMSHEIRTPMTAILGYADVLHAKVEHPELLACIRTIKENGAYLCEILNDILDLSKIESGKLTVRRQPCSLIATLADVRSLMAVPATEKSLTLSVEFASEVPETLVTDSKLVRQVLVNLVGNAVKFTSQGGIRIVASCDAEREMVAITVIDTGIGIDPDDMNKLFVPFEQIDNSFTRRTGGTGLGLAISRELARRLGGDLSVESEVGKGSSFCFTFATGSLDDAEWQKPDPTTLRDFIKQVDADRLPTIDARILAADDRREIRFLVGEFVKAAGGQIETVADGAAAVQAYLDAREHGKTFDVILMDVQMPVMDGLEATAKLRSEGFHGPIIALTANVMKRDRDKCITAGCDDLVAKPIDRGELIRRIASHLDASQSIRPGVSSDAICVLCVDDDRAMGHMHQTLLVKRGFVVATAESAEEALSVSEDFVPDVALIDLGLGRVSGGQLLSQLKTKPPFARCAFVCLSGRSEDESNWKELGFDHFVQKPADVESIERIVRKFCRR